jgi:hypothetical protein
MNKIVSIHIPKAAGTSFRKILENLFGSSNIAPPRIIPSGSSKDEGEAFLKGPWRVCHNHWAIDAVKEWGEVDIISILREPVERYLSYYNFWKSMPPASITGKYFQRFKKENPSFVDFLKYDFMANESFEYVRPELKHKFKFIGTVEYLKESVDTLSEMYGCPKISESVRDKRYNVAPRALERNNFSEEELLEIKSILHDEIVFYEEILSLKGKKGDY